MVKQNRNGVPGLIARSQSVDGRHARAIWRGLRRFVHLRYVRAIVAAVSSIAILGSAGALTVAIQHDVSTAAVVRYFVRPHSEEADLSRYFRAGATAVQLEPFLLLPPGVTPGGLVYVEEHGLVFYTHTPARQAQILEERREKAELFNQLTPLYFRRDLDNLVRELNRPSVRRRLIEEGAQLRDLYAFQRFNGVPIDNRARTQLLRSAARQIQLVAPYIPEPFEMNFSEALRFYETHEPAGEFVGQWEVAAPTPFGTVDAEYAFDMSEHNHYVIISKLGERTLVSDFYQGVRRDYGVEQLDNASGRTLFRLTALPAS